MGVGRILVWLKHTNHVFVAAHLFLYLRVGLRLVVITFGTLQLLHIVLNVQHDCVQALARWAGCACYKASFFGFIHKITLLQIQ